MAITHGFEITVGGAVTADKKAEIMAKIVQVLAVCTRSVTYVTTYSAGSTSVNQFGLVVGGDSADFGIRILMDSAVVSNKVIARVQKLLVAALESETIVPAYAATYTAGDRAYNLTISLT